MARGSARSSLGDEPLTVLHDGLVCLSGSDGAIDPASSEGLYFRDVRLLSRLELKVSGRGAELLTSHREGSSVAHQVYVVAADRHGSPTGVLWRRREVSTVLVDRYRIESFGQPLTGLELVVRLESDFLPALKDAGPRPRPHPYASVDGGWEAAAEAVAVRVEVEGPAPRSSAGGLSWTVDALPGAPFEVSVVVGPREEGAAVTSTADAAPSASRLSVTAGAPSWRYSVASATADIAALRMRVPRLDLTYLAAGAPWFMALFGRDTLLTGWASLITGTDIALEALEALARYQGERDDPHTAEQPGKILHELRTGCVDLFGIASGQPYYGTVDASPLFVMLLAECYRWGADVGRVRSLLPAARAALEWCATGGDPDGDGYVEYAADEHALTNQGWKDSAEPMVHADGAPARQPIALAEVQAYVWAAYQGLARLEEDLGDVRRADHARRRARSLREAFHRDYWLADRGIVAMALDGDKQPLAVASSNMGHCLWAGILADDVAAAVASRLDADDLRARWGIRTLAASEITYNPFGYHIGSIWPHDAALGAAGLMRYGHADVALRVVTGLLAAAEHFGWRLPELFSGLDDEIPYPVPYPVACSPQAWSAAVPLLLLRSVLRLEPDVPAGRLGVAPALPDGERLEVTGIPLGARTLDVRVQGREIDAVAAPRGIQIDTTTLQRSI